MSIRKQNLSKTIYNINIRSIKKIRKILIHLIEKILAYADDIAVITRNLVNLKKVIDIIKEEKIKINLKLNNSKCGIYI